MLPILGDESESQRYAMDFYICNVLVGYSIVSRLSWASCTRVLKSFSYGSRVELRNSNDGFNIDH